MAPASPTTGFTTSQAAHNGLNKKIRRSAYISDVELAIEEQQLDLRIGKRTIMTVTMACRK
jgi:hypothetical protein